MAATNLASLVRAAALLLGVAVLAASCGGSSGPKSTPTSSPYATAVPTANPGPTPAPSGISAFTFIDPLHGWAIANCLETFTNANCDVAATNDGGQTWTVRYRSYEILKHIQFLDAQHGFAVTRSQTIYTTVDGGSSWETSGTTEPSGLGSIHFATRSVGYAIAAGVIFKTTDAGATWLFAFGSADCTIHAISFPTQDVGWAGGRGPNGPCVYHTTDGTRTWRKAFEGAGSQSVAAAFQGLDKFLYPTPASSSAAVAYFDKSCRVYRMDFPEAARGWMSVGCNGGLGAAGFTGRTMDDAQSWQFVWGQGECLNNCQAGTHGQFPLFFLDARHAWRQAPGHAVASSADGGATWVEGAGLPIDVGYCCDEAYFVDPLNGWTLVGGRSLASTHDGGRTWKVQPTFIVP